METFCLGSYWAGVMRSRRPILSPLGINFRSWGEMARSSTTRARYTRPPTPTEKRVQMALPELLRVLAAVWKADMPPRTEEDRP